MNSKESDNDVEFQISVSKLDGKSVKHTLPCEGEVGITQFLSMLEDEPWGDELVAKGRINPPYALIINDQLVMLKENPSFVVHPDDSIIFIPMLSGG